MDLDYICTCGHVIDEYEDSFMAPCLINGCYCESYDPDPDDNESPDD